MSLSVTEFLPLRKALTRREYCFAVNLVRFNVAWVNNKKSSKSFKLTGSDVVAGSSPALGTTNFDLAKAESFHIYP